MLRCSHIFSTQTDDASNLLLKNAIKDSKEKATVLSEAAGVKLEDIVLIDYSWGKIEFLSRPMDSMMEERMMHCEDAAPGAYDIDIEPDDINVSDTVTVVWQIG